MNGNTQKELKCTRYLTGEMEPEDRLVFEIELSVDEELLELFRDYKTIWQLYPQTEFDQSDSEIDNSSPARGWYKKLSKPILSLAAVLLVVVVSLHFFKGSNSLIHQITTAKNERIRVLLPDSSEVVLNSKSSIEYPDSYDEIREVTLKGEAYFKITKDKQRPFIVHNNGFDVKVLGTSFSVNTHTDRKKISLKEGKVEVLIKDNNDKITLNPNEQLLLDTNKNRVIKRNFNVHTELSWVDNLLILENLPFKEALTKIDSFYGVRFIINDPHIQQQRITGAFKDQNLEDFISSLEFITNVKVIYDEACSCYLIKAIKND